MPHLVNGFDQTAEHTEAEWIEHFRWLASEHPPSPTSGNETRAARRADGGWCVEFRQPPRQTFWAVCSIRLPTRESARGWMRAQCASSGHRPDAPDDYVTA